MKKISLIVAALAACSMGLVSCGGSDNPQPGPGPVVVDGVTSVTVTGAPASLLAGQTAQLTADVVVTGSAAKTVTWSVDKPGLASIDQNGLLTAVAEGSIVVTARSTVDASKFGTATIALSVIPEIKSVTINGAPSKMYVGETKQLTAVVDAVGSISKAIRWSSNSAGVIDVNSSGVISANSAGTAVITATPVADPTKAQSVTITVVEHTWSDDLVAQMKEVLGEPIPYVSEFDGVLAYVEEDDEFYGEIEEEADLEKVEKALTKAGYSVTKDSLDYVFIVMENVAGMKYLEGSRIVVSVENVLDPYELLGGNFASLEAYLDVAETEWPTEIVDAYSPQYMDFDKETVPSVDADYYYLNGGDELTIELKNAAVSADEYLKQLSEAGWEIEDDPEAVEYYQGYFCSSPLNTVGVIVQGEGTDYALTVSPMLPKLSEYPADYVNAYVKNNIGSMFTLPAFEMNDGFYYSEYESETGDYAVLNVGYEKETPEAEIDAYVSAYAELLESKGFAVEYTERIPAEDEESYSFGPSLVAQKGKLCVELSESEQYYEYDLIIYADDEAVESPIILKKDSYVVCEESDAFNLNVTIDPEFAGKGTLSYSVDKDTVATVDESGNVTPVGVGEAVVTVTYTISESEMYNANVLVKVVPVATGIKVVAKEEMKSTETQALDFAFIPEGSLPVGEIVEATYEIVDGGEFASIENGVLTPNAEAIAEAGEDVIVTVIAKYGEEVTSDAFSITIKAVTPSTTFDFSKITTTSGSQDGFTYTSALGGGQSAPAYNANKKELRLYIGNTITISSTVGNMTSIFFDANTCGEEKATGTLSCNVGTVTAVSGGFQWTGNASEVTFTVNSGKQVHINEIVIGDGEPGPGPSPTEKTAEDYIKEISYNLFEDSSKYQEEDGYYYVAVSFGTTSEITMLEAVEEAIYYTSEDFLIDEEPAEGTWDDGDEGVFATLVLEDYSVICEIGSYVDDGDVVVQYCVYDN